MLDIISSGFVLSIVHWQRRRYKCEMFRWSNYGREAVRVWKTLLVGSDRKKHRQQTAVFRLCIPASCLPNPAFATYEYPPQGTLLDYISDGGLALLHRLVLVYAHSFGNDKILRSLRKLNTSFVKFVVAVLRREVALQVTPHMHTRTHVLSLAHNIEY